jgi:hypothetical protein
MARHPEMDRWTAAATERLRARFAEDGVVRAEYVVGFVEPYGVSVWLGTETDAQRDKLAARPGLRVSVSDVLAEVGMSESAYVFRGVVVQSEETVQRDYDGSWFYALR